MRDSPGQFTFPNRVEAGVATPQSEPTFRAYGSGAPNWLGLPIYIAFSAFAVAAVAPQVGHPYPLTGVVGFLTRMMDRNVFVFAPVAAFAVWRSVTWRLRSRYPDKLLVSADDIGIRLPSGYVISYSSIRRIDPCCRGTDNWIEIAADQRYSWKIGLNMSVDPPEQILMALRERAFAGGAKLSPEWMNGRAPTGGSQLGYRMGVGWRG